jgi:hypothetical protein
MCRKGGACQPGHLQSIIIPIVETSAVESKKPDRDRIARKGIYTIHRIFVDNTNQQSVASRLRQKRFQLFIDMLNSIPRTVSVLDLGGTQHYWEMMAKGSSLLEKVQVTVLNIQPQKTSVPNFTSVAGDARDMPQCKDKQFDFIHSNSTIEHVGNYLDQKKMADEVARIGKRYYVQTPNRYFPIEPHFVFPFFQFLPIPVRVWLLQHFKLGKTARRLL